ncbi:hypothetical protein KY347_02105 [Candidatus Woesearchaeota archaeon]|nr:hypothetical protein [Candidatus Woesearchaeota archaeon]
MQISYLSYFLASVTAYLGLLFGIILVKLAPEEQKPGKKYFVFLRKIIFFLILASLLFFYEINMAVSLVSLGVIIVLMSNKQIKLDKSALVYFFLGIAFYLSTKILSLFVLESALVFLYGAPNASLSLSLKQKNYYEIFLRNLWFFVPVVVLCFLT